MRQFADVFAWECSDLKTYDKNVIQHKIPLEKDTIPFKQKLRPMNPLLLPLVEKEIKKLLAAKIIVPLRYSKWVANLVVVRKKNGEIRLCVDFRNLNKCSKKDNYPLPKMEHLLQQVSGTKVMSFIDGFSGFNQIAVHPDDQEKTTITTPWGTFMYAKMPFGLMNAGATFQCVMDIAFVGEKDKFMLIYLDDITVYFGSHHDHLQHLKRVFLKCRKFGISLNPKKSQFALEEGKLLGHVVSAAGVQIDPERVKAIQALALPRSKKDIQSFLGKINFVRRFIPNFAELVKHITSMLKKGAEQDEAGREHPVAFFSKNLRDVELRYDIIEKKAYALVKYLKDFRVYILHSKIVAYVPSAAIKDVLTQPDVDGKRAKWIAKMIEFNIEMKPTKLVRGQGLAKLLTEENCGSLDIDFLFNVAENGLTEEHETAETKREQSVPKSLASCSWYAAIINFLLRLEFPSDFSQSQPRTLKLKATKYCINDGFLYWRDPSGVLLRCLDKEQSIVVMQ
eukprot:PITA_36509